MMDDDGLDDARAATREQPRRGALLDATDATTTAVVELDATAAARTVIMCRAACVAVSSSRATIVSRRSTCRHVARR